MIRRPAAPFLSGVAGRKPFGGGRGQVVCKACIDHLRRLRPGEVPFDEIDVERLTASDGPDGFGRMMDLQWCESCRLAARHYVLHETPVSPVHREIHHRLDKLIEAYARELAE